MTIEQRPELNRFVDPSIPLTWKWRWHQVKVILPILVFTFFCLLEIKLFKARLADKLSPDIFLAWLVVCVFVFLLFLGIIEAQVRTRQRSKRAVQFKNNKITVKPARNQLIRWEKVAKFQFEPIPETPGMTKMKLFLSGRTNKTTSARPFWAMVLEYPSQVSALVGYLQTKKMEVPTNFDIQMLGQPSIPEKAIPFPLLGWSLCWCGSFLLLNGGPILLTFLSQSDHKSKEHSNLTPQEIAKLGRFIAQHFSSKEEFRHFVLTLSIGLVIAGITLLIWGWWLMNRRTQVEHTRRSA